MSTYTRTNGFAARNFARIGLTAPFIKLMGHDIRTVPCGADRVRSIASWAASASAPSAAQCW